MLFVKQNRCIPRSEYAAVRRQLDPRTAALCDLLRFTGYRLDDILHTSVGMWRGDQITIREAKTGNVRTVSLSPGAQNAVRALIAYRPWVQDDEPMFPGVRKRPWDAPWMHRTTVWRRFERAIKAARLEGRGYTVHSLRKLYAVEAYDRTGSLMTVQRDLGHKKIETTLWYVAGSDIRL